MNEKLKKAGYKMFLDGTETWHILKKEKDIGRIYPVGESRIWVAIIEENHFGYFSTIEEFKEKFLKKYVLGEKV